MGHDLRSFLATLFGIPASSSEEAFLTAARQFLKAIGSEVFDSDSDEDALLRWRLQDLQAELNPNEIDLQVAKNLGISAEEWKREALRRFVALATSADLSPTDRAVAKQLGLSPTEMALA